MQNYFNKMNLGIIFIVLFAFLGCGNISANSNNPEPLQISAFKDITAFVLESAQKNGSINVNIKYVKNANEAHTDLTGQKADLVFMSYDDTLSIALEENNSNAIAIMPIHGGILDFCGSLNIEQNQTNIGIDTKTGYARALRSYLKMTYSHTDYNKLNFVFAGATNLRYEKLLRHELNATLLNPPYSYALGVNRMVRISDVFGAYQGVVVNANKSWLATGTNKDRLYNFAKAYYQTVANIKNQPDKTIEEMQIYYGITKDEATQSYNRLWESDGLSLNFKFNDKALIVTEQIFSFDANISIPNKRTWVDGFMLDLF
ncbi:MAG: hypothetical protein RL154_661 [Pseudomonadota bacterium]|jgi:hypothetical protein